MNIDWDTNWAPTIITMVGTILFTLFGAYLGKIWGARKRPHSENIEAISPEGTTSKFSGVKTYSRRRVEIDPSGGRKFTEEVFQFESSEEGSSTVSTEDIEIDGLESDASTSIGDDKEITVDQNESIFFTLDTYYAEVHLNLYNDEWSHVEELNWTVGDRTEGNGKDGIYEFIPDVDTMGYIVISAMEGVPVRQDTAMTGSLSIRGTVLPIGGATAKVEAAAKAGIKRIIVPKSNLNDVLVEDKFKKGIEVIPVETLTEVIENTLAGPGKKELLKKLKAMKPLKITGKVELESEKKMTATKPEVKEE